MSIRVGIDIGGTFTDLVAYDEETRSYFTSKVPSTPRSPDIGFMNSLRDSAVDMKKITYIAHGTTLVTNTVVERAGVKVGLITTKGFRDILELMRAAREFMYDIQWDPPTPVVPRYLRKEVDERINAEGEVLKPLDVEGAEKVVDELADEGVEVLAVCLINSYLNPVHEKRIAEIIEKRHPELPFCCSYDVNPEILEYERTCTTVYNAYVKPRVEEYTGKLAEQAGEVFYVKSDGGIAPRSEIVRNPISLIRSGPAAGDYASLYYSRLLGIENVITFDMGGTSAEASLIRRGRFDLVDAIEPQYMIKIRTPSIYFTLIGAGGGSIAWIDEGGAFRVGPRSAGAEPGPACYGMGGTEPTVTDANLILRLLNPDYFLGGKIKIDPKLARDAFEPLVKRLGGTLEDVAEGTRRVVNANMSQLLRELTVERGIDPRDYTMIAYGGGSGLHIAYLARELGIKTIIVPHWPAHHSAFGAIASDITYSTTKTVWRDLETVSPDDLNREYEELERRGAEALGRGGIKGELNVVRRASMRYAGQWHEVTVGAPENITAKALEVMERSFHEEHLMLYGVKHDDIPVELMTIRSTTIAPVSPPTIKKLSKREGAPPRPVETRRVWLEGEEQDVRVFRRPKLLAGDEIGGGSIVEEEAATILVPPWAAARIGDYGNIFISID